MKISIYIIRLNVKGLVHSAFRGPESQPLNETRKYASLGTSYEDALDRVRRVVSPKLHTMYQSLVMDWGSEGHQGDFFELTVAQSPQLTTDA